MSDNHYCRRCKQLIVIKSQQLDFYYCENCLTLMQDIHEFFEINVRILNATNNKLTNSYQLLEEYYEFIDLQEDLKAHDE